VQAHIDRCGICTTDSILSDIHSSPAWAATYSKDGIFKGDARGISFGLCTDGVNPFSHLRTSYSMIPIVMSLLNLPRNVRHSFGNILSGDSACKGPAGGKEYPAIPGSISR
jgi:hypothetical protein